MNDNKQDTNNFFCKIKKILVSGWDGFWLFFHRLYSAIARFFKFIYRYLFQKGIYVAIKFIFKYVFRYIYLGFKYFFKYTIVLLFVSITKLFVKNNENKDYHLKQAKKIGSIFVIASLVIVGIIFYDYVFDYTLGYVFKFGFYVFGQMDNSIGRILTKYNELLWHGTKTTIILSVLGTLIGFFMALIMGLLVTQKEDKRNRYGTIYLKKFGKFLTKIYVTVIRSTPMMVQGIVIYYAFLLPVFNMNASSSIYPAVIIVSINTAAYLTEVIRGGIESIDKGQTEGARSLGLSSWKTMTSVVYPQAIKNSMPAIGNELIINIKDTSVLSVIMVTDLFYICQQVIYATNLDWITYLIAAAIYLVLTLSFSAILRKVVKKFDIKPRNLPSAN
ncbi:amino acid ABC transporter permease [Acholeplasma sp. OttesenSCG-928-E16]|nr:amino acid ABC transporter permease [Acholeplasma sp. OttesenSCG-928-E16]